MELTKRQLDVLNHVVVDGQEWADNAKKESYVLDKVAKYESAYDEAVAKGNYLNRKQRDEEEERLRREKYDNVPWNKKRQREYPSFADQLDYIYHHGIDKWKADMVLPVKNKYPKGNS